MNYKSKKWFSFLLIAVTYFVATFIGIISYNLLPFSFWLNLLLADVISTVFVFIISLLCKNASVYDPYWSVQPIVIVGLFLITYRINTTTLIIFVTIFIWGVRLTINWAYTFNNLTHQDWRYTMLHETCKKLYPIINFIGIHMVPTLIVYACTLPAVFAIYYDLSFTPLMLIFVLLSLVATIIQATADIQMHKFRKNKKSNFIRSGLWKYSRHPNYLGEILMWWSVGLSVFVLNINFWYLLFGALANTILFLSVSIPMADKRQSRKNGFSEYKKSTRMLLPIKK